MCRAISFNKPQVMRFNHMQTRFVSQIITVTVIIQVIVFPKPQNPDEVRICVDMSAPNCAIQRLNHPMPTVNDLIHDLLSETWRHSLIVCRQNFIICEGDKFVFKDLGCYTVNGFIKIDVMLLRSKLYCYSGPYTDFKCYNIKFRIYR